MELNEVIQKTKEIIYQTTNIKPETIADDASFVEDLKLDSLTMLEIAINVDQEYDLDLPEEELQKLTNVKVAAEMVMAKLGEKAGS